MRQSRAILVEYVQEMRADLFNLTSISKKNKLYCAYCMGFWCKRK